MSETNLSSIDPQVDIVNDDAQQPAEDQQTSVDKQMSEALGIKLVTGATNPHEAKPGEEGSEESAEPTNSEGGEEASAEPPQTTPPNGEDEEELTDENFLGKPDENGNYTLSERRLAYLRDKLYQTMQFVNAREAQHNQQLENYRRQIEELNRSRQQTAEQNQTSKEQPPKVSKWEEGRAAFEADIASVLGEEDAKRVAGPLFNLFREAIKEEQAQGFEKIQPLLNRVQDEVYKDDVLKSIDYWSSNISEDLANFNVPREAAEPEVRTFVANFIRGFHDSCGRRPTAQEIDEGIARASSKLTTATLLNRMQANIRARQQQASQAAAAAQPAAQPAAPPASQQAKPEAKKPTTEPSTTVARKMVTTGENLRIAKDAGLMGTPSGGVSTGNPALEKMAQAIAQSNGGRKFFVTE